MKLYRYRQTILFEVDTQKILIYTDTIKINMEKPMTDKKVIFEFLNDLRASGRINMFGAAPYLQSTFELTRDEARNILKEWMDSKSKGDSTLLQE